MLAWLAALFRTNGALDHWQTLVTGGIAIAAAAVAYFAGMIQAGATREAAKQQVEAARKAARDQVEAADRQVAAARPNLFVLVGGRSHLNTRPRDAAR